MTQGSDNGSQAGGAGGSTTGGGAGGSSSAPGSHAEKSETEREEDLMSIAEEKIELLCNDKVIVRGGRMGEGRACFSIAFLSQIA